MYGGNEGQFQHFKIRWLIWMRCHFPAPAVLHPRKECTVPIRWKLGGSQHIWRVCLCRRSSYLSVCRHEAELFCLSSSAYIMDQNHRPIEIKASETFCCNLVNGRLTRRKVSTCTGTLKSTGIYLRSKRILNMHSQCLRVLFTYNMQVKNVKLSLEQAVKVQRRSRRIPLLFL